MSDSPIIEALKLTREFRQHEGVVVNAVRGVSLEVRRGEFVALVGPSGCGKSTLLSMLGLIELPSSGSLVFEGHSLSGFHDFDLQRLRREKIGFVFQAFNLLSTLTVEENVMLSSLLNGATESEAREQARDELDKLGLAKRFNALPASLSGGEAQRVAIARAVVHRPALIIADEPTGNLEPTMSVGIMKLLDRINRTGTTVVMATHDSGIVDQMRKRVIELEGGLVVRDQVRGVYGYSG